MRRDLYSGILLIAGALAGVFVMSFHPTAHDMIAGADAAVEGIELLRDRDLEVRALQEYQAAGDGKG